MMQQAQQGFIEQAGYQLPPEIDTGEELAWLMSLALDGELTPVEEARLQALLAADDGSAAVWQVWQTLDADLNTAPNMEPPADFGESFNARLARREQRRRLRTGVVFGLAAVGLWGSAVFGILVLGAFLWTNQVALMGDAVHQLALWWSACMHFGETLFETGGELIAAPQARYVAGGYLLMAVAILGAWIMYLRRSLRVSSLSIQ